MSSQCSFRLVLFSLPFFKDQCSHQTPTSGPACLCSGPNYCPLTKAEGLLTIVLLPTLVHEEAPRNPCLGTPSTPPQAQPSLLTPLTRCEGSGLSDSASSPHHACPGPARLSPTAWAPTISPPSRGAGAQISNAALPLSLGFLQSLPITLGGFPISAHDSLDLQSPNDKRNPNPTGLCPLLASMPSYLTDAHVFPSTPSLPG